MQVGDFSDKFRVFAFDWKMSWKYFEKYLKQKLNIRGQPDISQRRRQILAFVRRALNDNRVRVITKGKIDEVSFILRKEAGDNRFFQQASQYFIMFLQDILI